MAYESYCASCSHLSETRDLRKYFCFMKRTDVYANASKCGNHLTAYSRSDDKREEMYRYSSGYYITTAILSILRALDNNHQIKVFGDFIENTLRKDMKYFPFLVEYEILGPAIAAKMQQDKDKIRIASTMFYQYIKPTIKAINKNETENAVKIYREMTLYLADRYDISTDISISSQDINDVKSKEQVPTRKRVYQKPTITFISDK